MNVIKSSGSTGEPPADFAVDVFFALAGVFGAQLLGEHAAGGAPDRPGGLQTLGLGFLCENAGHFAVDDFDSHGDYSPELVDRSHWCILSTGF
jgi:hypothetical protein